MDSEGILRGFENYWVRSGGLDFEIGGFESDFWGVYAVKTLVAECFFGCCGVGNGVVDVVVSVEKGGVGGEF